MAAVLMIVQQEFQQQQKRVQAHRDIYESNGEDMAAEISTWELIKTVVEVAVIPFSLWIVNTLRLALEELRTLRTVLIGVDGKNGMRSRLRRLEKRVEALALQQAARHGEVVEFDDSEDE